MGNSMTAYMILLAENESEQQGIAPSETKALIEGHASYATRLRASGAYRDSGRFRPSAEGKRVDSEKVEDGPFGESHAFAGYYVVEADDLGAATALAEHCPMAAGDTLELRPIMGGQIGADKTSRQGKTFAFLVLGKAVSEAAWVAVMDRIDAETHDSFPQERFVGGVRLEAPGRGRAIASRGPTRTFLDGPFLESKEVIGGVVFLRMTDIDEAVRWARESNFVKHGALEIRELWRS